MLFCREAIVSDKWVIDELEDIDIGSYLGLPRQYLPEVFFENLLPGEELHRRGGCQGLEVSSAGACCIALCRKALPCSRQICMQGVVLRVHVS